MTKDYFIILLLINLLLYSCGKSKFSKNEFDELLSQENLQLITEYNGENTTLYRIKEDNGEKGTNLYYFYYKIRDNYYYKIGKNAIYQNDQIWNQSMMQTCAYSRENIKVSGLSPSKWIEIEIITKPGKSETIFNHSPEIPNEFKFTRNLEDGIFKWENEGLKKKGTLNELCLIYEFESGLYFLNPPGVFFSEFIDVDDVTIK